MRQIAPNLSATKSRGVETHADQTMQYFNIFRLCRDYIGNVGRMSTHGYSLANQLQGQYLQSEKQEAFWTA